MTLTSEPGQPVWPRCYTPDELEAIARSVGHDKLNALATDELQEAVEAYQWGCLVDDGEWGSLIDDGKGGSSVIFFSSNRGRRTQLKHIVKLYEQGAADAEIERAVDQLDAFASQLLGPIDSTDPKSVQSAAKDALKRIPTRGPDPKRARRQFIVDLGRIYSLATGRRPGRRVHDQEYGPFRDFVRAALEPFNATTGSDADIKAALKTLKSV